jgi:N-acetylglucosaminyldiphosphoundecaprenol N-acetyl-beta-D-mannosaminyltransferase
VRAKRPSTGRRRLPIDGVEFDAVTEDEASAYVMDCLDARVGGLIVTPNVDILRLLREPDGQTVAARADLVVADGMPVVWASRLAGTPVPERVAGSSLVRTLARDAAQRGRSLYLLGGPPGAQEVAAKNLQASYPGLAIAGVSCPRWGFQDDPEQWAEVVAHLRETRPDVVYLGLGALKQERISLRLGEIFPEMWFLGCGASITFLAGFIPQAPMWMQRSGLEWVHRLSREPRRLWRRYLVDDIPYALALLSRSARAGRASR